MRMNCSEALAELPLFVGDDLESSCHGRVAAHLESCSSCRAALAQAAKARGVLQAGLQRTADLHGAFVATSPKPSVWPDLRERLRAEGLIQGQELSVTNQPELAPTATPVARGKLLRWIPSAAAAAGLLLLGGVAGQLWNGGGTSVPPVALTSDAEPTPAGFNEPTLVEVLPALQEPAEQGPGRKGQGLKELLSPADSYTRDALLFHGEQIQPFNAFRGSSGGGLRMVSYPGSSQRFRPARSDGMR